ncbi:hypothetical protein [Campylobacter hyointestinalis]|uniref:hypothetical protein n=1 Tax=Campylobacter hyointestinalis TaxID=198 RepID=UPI000B1D6029
MFFQIFKNGGYTKMSLIDKLENGQRLGYDEGLALYDLDLFTLGKYANKVRQKLNSNKVYFNINRHINPTNLCADTCKFCAFSLIVKTTTPTR